MRDRFQCVDVEHTMEGVGEQALAQALELFFCKHWERED